MEAQEIFDTVAKHLFTQGRQALKQGSESSCAYRGEGGTKCAVGVLIPDQLYLKSMEGTAIHGLLDKLIGVALPEWMTDKQELLSNLQSAHDTSFNWENGAKMRRALNRVAAESSLSTAVLEELAFPWESKEEV
jgi:hypothetical protein